MIFRNPDHPDVAIPDVAYSDFILRLAREQAQ